MQQELRYLGEALHQPKRPFVAVLGGAKISGKIDLIEALLPKVDAILLGGAMACTFFRAMGLETGKSLVEEDRLDLARQLMSKAGGKLVLPGGRGDRAEARERHGDPGRDADLLAGVARRVIGVDYDESAVAHVRARYPRVEGDRETWPSCRCPTASVDVVVNFQVIEHLWDQSQFVAECRRVLRPGGLLLMSTPNRITFSPGSDTPLNPFHTRELNAAELTELLVDEGFAVESMPASFTARGCVNWTQHGGSIIDAQIARALADAPWPDDLLADVAGVTTADFDLLEADR